MGRRNRTPLPLKDKLEACAQSALAKKAERVLSLDVRQIAGYADAFVICSGEHARQNQTIADAIADELSRMGDPVLGIEGYERGNWILIDAGDVIVHVFDEPTRLYYNLEQLWHDAPRQMHTDEPAAAARSR